MTFTNTPIIFLFLLFSFLLCLFEKTLFKYVYVWKRGAVECVCTLHTRLHVINEKCCKQLKHNTRTMFNTIFIAPTVGLHIKTLLLKKWAKIV